MRQVGFKIVLDSSGLKGAGLKDVKDAIGELRKLETGLKQDGRIDKGLGRSVTNLDKMAVSFAKVNPLLTKYVKLMREAVTLAIPNVPRDPNRPVVNNGNRTGFNASPARVAASAFSAFVRRGESFTSQIGSVVSGASRFASIGNVGLGVATFASAEVVRQAVKMVEITREFSAASADLAARLGTTRGGVKELTDDAIRLGDSMVYTASEIVGVQVELAKLGFNKEAIKSITQDVARFAVVSGGSIEDSAKLAGATLQVFEKDASQIEDVVKLLGLSTAKTAIDFESLRQGATQLFATANSFGLELSDTLALLGALKNAGLSDSVAATASRNILLNLADDGGKLRDVLGQLGVESVKGLDGIVGALNTLKASGIDLAGTFELTDKRSVNAFNTFLRGADSLQDLEKSINGTNEEFRIMERERLNSLDGDIKLFQSNVESLALSLGVEGLARSFVIAGTAGVRAVKDIIVGFRELTGSNVDANEELSRYLDILGDVSITDGERNLVIAELKTLYGDYLEGIDLEKITLEEIAVLKARISSEDIKKQRAIQDQTLFNELLREEERLTRKIIEAKVKDVGLNIQGTGGDALGRAQRDLQKNDKDLIKFLNSVKDVSKISTSDLEQIRNLSNRAGDNPVGIGARRIVGQFNNRLNQITGTEINPKNRRQALGLVVGGQVVEKGQIQDRIDLLEEIKKGLSSESALTSEISKEIERINKLRENFATGTVSPRDGRKSDKVEEVFVNGSLAFFEKELSTAEEDLKRISQTDVKYVERAAAVKNLREKVEIAKKRQEELTKTTRELAEEELKSGKDALEKEFRGDKGLVSELDKKIETTKLDIKFAQDEGDNTDILTATLKDLSKKYIEAYTEYYNGLKLEGIGDTLNKSIEENALRADERILAGENPIIVELEQAIEDSKALDISLQETKKTLKTAKEIRMINNEIEKNLQKQNRARVGIEVENINQKFLDDSNALGGVDAALRYIKSGDLKKADQAIAIYEEQVRRLELIRDRDIALADGDQAKAKKIDFDLASLDFDKNRIGVERYRENLLDVVDALGQVGAALLDLQRLNIDQDEEDAISKIDREYKARIEAAKGNAAEEERLTNELERRKAEVEKKAAKERQALAIKEAIIGVALSIIQARSIVGRIAAVGIGAIQIATIRKQKFAKGGYYTGAGGQLDETGEYSTGNAILHSGEYVVRRKTVQKYPHVIKALDQDRLRYAQGGPNGFSIGGGGETRLSSSDIEYLTQSLSESMAASVYSSVMSATSKAYEQSTEVLKNSRATRDISRRENYSLNSY